MELQEIEENNGKQKTKQIIKEENEKKNHPQGCESYVGE